MQASRDNNNLERSGWQSKKCFEGCLEGWLREVTHEFGGQPFCGGGNRASSGVGTGALSHFFSFIFAKFIAK
jgi:hypothetical protein